MQESYEQLVARVNASAYIEHVELEPRRKLHRLALRAKKLNPEHLEALQGLLSGSWALVRVGGRSYALTRDGEEWRVLGLYEGAVERRVARGACSCEDSRFRGRKCKHAQAVEKFR
jgi:hypothetical protein